jgi:hypothetical protein
MSSKPTSWSTLRRVGSPEEVIWHRLRDCQRIPLPPPSQGLSPGLSFSRTTRTIIIDQPLLQISKAEQLGISSSERERERERDGWGEREREKEMGGRERERERLRVHKRAHINKPTTDPQERHRKLDSLHLKPSEFVTW